MASSWQVVRFQDIGELIRGVSYTPDDAQERPAPGYLPVLRATNIQDGTLNLRTELVYVKEERVSSGQRLVTGDVVIAMSSGSKSVVGKSGQLLDQWDGSFGAFCAAYRLTTDAADALFVGYLFQTDRYREHIGRSARGTNINNLTKEHILGYELNLPPTSDQKEIANALHVVQNARTARQCELALERERKAALMEHLFTHGTRSREGVKPKSRPIGWNLVQAGELIAEGPQNGIYKHQDAYGSGTQILRINDFDNDGLLISSVLNQVSLSDEEVNLYRLREGDILINRVNSLSHLGKSLLVRKASEPTVFESNMMRLRIDESKVLPDFFCRHLLTDSTRNYMRGRAKRAVAQSSVSQGDIRSIPISVPPIAEQQEIVDVLDGCDRKLKSLTDELTLLQELFDALLEELMTGKVSVEGLIDGGSNA